MKVIISRRADGVLLVRVRIEGMPELSGELTEECRYRSDFLGYRYEELSALGEGEHDLWPK